MTRNEVAHAILMELRRDVDRGVFVHTQKFICNALGHLTPAMLNSLAAEHGLVVVPEAFPRLMVLDDDHLVAVPAKMLDGMPSGYPADGKLDPRGIEGDDVLSVSAEGLVAESSTPFDFSEALRRMRDGARVARVDWPDLKRLLISEWRGEMNFFLTDHQSSFSLWDHHHDDLLAEDWIERKTRL